MNSFEKIIFYISLFLIVFFSYPVFSPVHDRLPLMMNWIQIMSGTIYVGLIFFQLFVLPKGSLQSTIVTNRYQTVLNTAFIVWVLSVLVDLVLQAATAAEFTWTKAAQARLLQIFFLLMIFILPLWQKNIIFRRWTSFGFGVCLFAAKAIMNDHYTVMLSEFLHLLSLAILIGSLTAMIILLPIRRRKEGEFFLNGMIYLFLPWGYGAFLVFTAAGFYGFLTQPFYRNIIVGEMTLLFLLLFFISLFFLKTTVKDKKS